MTGKQPGSISRERILLSGKRRCSRCGKERPKDAHGDLCRTCRRLGYGQ